MLRRDLKKGDVFMYSPDKYSDSCKYVDVGADLDTGYDPVTGLCRSRKGLGFDDYEVTKLVRNAGGVYELPTPVPEPTTTDPVNSPPHYARLTPQPIEVMAAWNLPCFPSMAIKYVARAGFKEGVDAITDYRKGISYLEREIARLQGKSVVKDVPNS